jgi:hypothetical protein
MNPVTASTATDTGTIPHALIADIQYFLTVARVSDLLTKFDSV